MPKLSVVMSVYNGEEFIETAIECILNQTYTDFELILINDGSKDGSLALMQSYADKDKRVRIIDQQNTGLTIALRRGVDAARGEYIARMDVDDLSLPDRFEKQMALIDAQPDLIAVTTDVEHVFENGTRIGSSRLNRDPRLLPLLLIFSNAIGGHGQMIYSREAYHAAGGYDPDFNLAEDYDLWARLADLGPFGRVPEFLYRYRVGHDSVSSLNKTKQFEVAGRVSRRQYTNVTGIELDDQSARALDTFIARGPLEDIPLSTLWMTPSVLKKAVNVFFKANPELRGEKYETLRHFAARWWWKRRELAQFNLVLMIIIMANVARLGTAAVVAKLLYGDTHVEVNPPLPKGERVDNWQIS
ncbi:MAG: glycosyltransferase [Pseudomonadota bacterium]